MYLAGADVEISKEAHQKSRTRKSNYLRPLENLARLGDYKRARADRSPWDVSLDSCVHQPSSQEHACHVTCTEVNNW